MLDLISRPRRLRSHSALRNLVAEVTLSLDHLIQPYFIAPGSAACEPIEGFTDVNRWGIEPLSKKIETDLERGLRSFLLFASAEDSAKDAEGSAALHADGLLTSTVSALKNRFGRDILLMTDVCLCPYTDHGHCGVLSHDQVDNDRSLPILAQMALVHAQAGVDFVAPSDMMDGRVASIRRKLDAEKFENVGILAYTAKYASNYYGPFRSALQSAPKGDRSTYQMDYRNVSEALRELELDEAEGADIVMVKPALAYLDVITRVRQNARVPVAAYSVSGEYEMVKRLAAAGLADEQRLAIENLSAIRRAGAHSIVTYFGSEIAEKGWLRT